MKFEESKHPRDSDGKFIDKNGKTATDKLRESVKKYSDRPAEDMEKMGVSEKPSIADFVARVKSGKAKPNEVLDLGKITDKARKDIENLTGQKINAIYHVISANEIRHIDKGHGEQGKSDNSMSTVKDYEQIPKVLSDYDFVDLVRNKKGEIDTTRAYLDRNGKPARLIKFTKIYPNQEQYVIEAVNDSKGRLHIISSYKKKAGSN